MSGDAISGFVRIPFPPKRARLWNFRYTPRGRWLERYSNERAQRNPMFAELFRLAESAMATGEIGAIESVRFIRSKRLD